MGTHIPKNIHDIICLKQSFQFSNQSLSSPCQITHSSWIWMNTKTWKLEKNTQNKLKIEKKMNFETHKVASFSLWTNFSPKIQQQQTQLQSQMMATWSLNVMLNHVGHSIEMLNVKLQNSSYYQPHVNALMFEFH